MKPHQTSTISIGCAGWSIPSSQTQHFPASGSHLERYGAHFKAVEINSSFYRPHRPHTYAKWAAAVPEHFRFAVKMPKSITHEHRLKNADEPLTKFFSEVAELGGKRGPLLVQLPPSLNYDKDVAGAFFETLREGFTGQVVCEPRHPSWFTPDTNALLTHFQVARVAAAPAIVPQAAKPGGWSGLVYYRLHGSPTIYRSAYSLEFLNRLSARMQTVAKREIPAWCVFDNTAEGAATGNAIELMARLR
jgi:uncharacterized protein YecE (DUF72 family)